MCLSRFLISLALFGVAASDAVAAGKLTLRSSEKLAASSPLINAVYLKPTGGEMLSGAGFSPDNGRTWQAFTAQPDFDSKLPFGYRREPFPLFVDPSNGRVISIRNSMDTPGVDPEQIEPPIALETYYLRYRVSTDGGRTYLCDEPIVHRGGGYTPEHPFDGITKGKNALFMGDCGSRLMRTRAGKILVPAQACVLGNDGKLANPGGGFTYTNVRVLIGTWQPDHRLQWEAADPVQVDPSLSTRGMIEPTIAEMPDGRLLMVMRGANGGSKDPDHKIPAYKWFSLSTDGGYHWTPPQPWKYSDNSPFFSPGSMSQLLAHSNGKTYWIGNISKENPRGNAPRFPLVAGEVDHETMMLKRDSILVIDDLRPDDNSGVELSPHAATFEDRETADLVLPMLRHTGGYKSSEPYVYRIRTK